MSHAAIAAALALEDVAAGERLVAFALASFANREHRAWPGTRIAAIRAGLSRSQYLAARESLERRGLVIVEVAGGGRGHSPVVALSFAQAGPWVEREVNAPLFEAVLSYSRTRGSARLLLAALGALADEHLRIAGVATEELRAAAGMADSTYRRARAALLTTGEVAVDTGGGRSRTSLWQLLDPRVADRMPVTTTRQRVPPPSTASPLLMTVSSCPADDAGANPTTSARECSGGPHTTGRPLENPPQGRTVSAAKGLGSGGVSVTNPAQNGTVRAGKDPRSSGVSRRNPAQSRTLSSETAPNTPPETPPPDARAGREPQNPSTSPPQPPEGGSPAGQVTIVEDYLSDRGRKRQRTVIVELDAIRDQLRSATDGDLADWERIRSELRGLVGDSTFEIWLAQIELAATDPGGRLLLAAPASTRSWIAHRFARPFDHASVAVDRSVRLADERELRLLDALATSPSPAAAGAAAPDGLPHFPHPNPHTETV